VTPAQKDGGKDVIAKKRGEVIYIECKNWRGRVAPMSSPDSLDESKPTE
jgi:hypothetical protein